MNLLHQDLEKQLLDKYGGSRSNLQLPQSLLFDHVSPATRLLEKRRQMFEVEDALVSQKDEFIRREEAFHRREDGLRRKDLDLQESLLKFNKFLKENESKRMRALKRANDEKKLCESKEEEIEELKKILEQTIQDDRKVKQELRKYIPYQEYLDNVVYNNSKYFSEVSDVLNRYKILHDANIQLVEKQINDDERHESTLKEYISFIKTNENETLGTNNKISAMRESLVLAYSEGQELQETMEKVTDEITGKIFNLGQVIRSINNIYARADRTFRLRHNKPSSITSTNNNNNGNKSSNSNNSNNNTPNNKAQKSLLKSQSQPLKPIKQSSQKPPPQQRRQSANSGMEPANATNATATANHVITVPIDEIELEPLSIQYKHALERLDFISGSIVDLTEVCDEYREHMKQLQLQQQLQQLQLQQQH